MKSIVHNFQAPLNGDGEFLNTLVLFFSQRINKVGSLGGKKT